MKDLKALIRPNKLPSNPWVPMRSLESLQIHSKFYIGPILPFTPNIRRKVKIMKLKEAFYKQRNNYHPVKYTKTKQLSINDCTGHKSRCCA
jgi:hypothetical protein